jgi:hypothetical protein
MGQSNDYILYEKLESGKYSIQAYLKAIIKEEYTEDDFKNYFKNNERPYPLVQGLVSSILINNHNSNYTNTHLWTDFEYLEFENQTYFHQNCQLRGNNELFIWGTYQREIDSFILNSRVVSNIEPTFFNFNIIKLNSTKLITFMANEYAVIGTEINSNWNAIKYEIPNQKNFTGFYKECVLEGDSTIKCGMTTITSLTEVIPDIVPIEKRLFTTKLIIEDVDNDKTLDFYWFAVSNGKLIYSENYALRNSKLKKENKKNLDEIIINGSYYRKLEKISKMITIPKL